MDQLCRELGRREGREGVRGEKSVVTKRRSPKPEDSR